MRKPPICKPAVSRERYILDSLERTFPNGEWMPPGSSSHVAQQRGSPTREEMLESNPALLGPGGILSHSKETPTQDIGEGISTPENGSGGRTEAYLTVIGGQKYDRGELFEHLPLDKKLIVGEGRGVESDLAKWGAEDPMVIHIPVNPDLYGKAARKVNVEQVISFAPTSPLLLVGNGERVKQAKQWLKRAKWPREVVELP